MSLGPQSLRNGKLHRHSRHGNKTGANTQSFRDIGSVFSILGCWLLVQIVDGSNSGLAWVW